MVAPERPIEIREFPLPDLPPGGALLRDPLRRTYPQRPPLLLDPGMPKAAQLVGNDFPETGRPATPQPERLA